MKTLLSLAALATAAVAPVAAFAQDGAVTPVAGKMIYAAGKRLGAVYRVSSDGSPQVIVDGRLVTIPASTLTVENGKFNTNLTKVQLLTR